MTSMKEPLPHFVERFSDGNYMVKNTQLATRDGRKIGNARVLKVKYCKELKKEIAYCISDMGNTFSFSEDELKEYFHKPRYIINLLAFLF